MSELVSWLGTLISLGLLALILSLVVSPLESLRWWAGWVQEPAVMEVTPTPVEPSKQDSSSPASQRYVVFLQGVGTVGTDLDIWEQRVVRRLADGVRDGIVIGGLFPYSATTRPLDEGRTGAGLWRWLEDIRVNHPNLLAHLIDWRNLTQVFVSADERYGPIYNAGTARKILAALEGGGYLVGSGAPVILIGYSGGAQVCLGAAAFVKLALRAPVTVISLGGVLNSDPSLEYVEHLYHLWGTRDLEQRLCAIGMPPRWPIAKRSRWNRALAAHKITFVHLGDMAHCAGGGYLDPESFAPDGRSYLEVTATAMLQIVNRESPVQEPATAPRPPA